MVTIAAPAKINLALHVVGRRPDGYHLIESLAMFTRFGDRLDAAPADADGFSASGRYAASVPLDGTNLVLRARDLLRRHFPEAARQPVGIALEKNLPAASGVGGGSSDAAAALKALAKVWGIEIAESELARLALPLGADLPMCLAARPLIARGIGDELALLPDFPPLGLVLVNPGAAVPTAEVFAALASRENDGLPPLPSRLDFHGLLGWLEKTRNDLQQPARQIAPEIGKTLAALDRADAAFSRMSGSGATCFGLFETGNVAKRAAAAIRARHPDWFVAATRNASPQEATHAGN